LSSEQTNTNEDQKNECAEQGGAEDENHCGACEGKARRQRYGDNDQRKCDDYWPNFNGVHVFRLGNQHSDGGIPRRDDEADCSTTNREL
jgi:hypothetical protein